MTSHIGVEALLARVRDWWRTQNELADINRNELDRVAADLGMTAGDLEDLVARGPDATNLLYERMRVLGISREEVARAAYGIMRDLEKTCACCNEKGVCKEDLTKTPDDPGWKSYCPNAVSLESLARLKDHFPA